MWVRPMEGIHWSQTLVPVLCLLIRLRVTIRIQSLLLLAMGTLISASRFETEMGKGRRACVAICVMESGWEEDGARDRSRKRNAECCRLPSGTGHNNHVHLQCCWWAELREAGIPVIRSLHLVPRVKRSTDLYLQLVGHHA